MIFDEFIILKLVNKGYIEGVWIGWIYFNKDWSVAFLEYHQREIIKPY